MLARFERAMSTSRTRMRWPNGLPVIMASYPLAWLGLFYLFVIRARLELGHWPVPYQPDPKSLGFIVHHQAIWFGAMTLPVVGLLTVALLIIGRRLGIHHRILPTLTLLLFFIILAVALAQLDPGDFFAWFWD